MRTKGVDLVTAKCSVAKTRLGVPNHGFGKDGGLSDQQVEQGGHEPHVAQLYRAHRIFEVQASFAEKHCPIPGSRARQNASWNTSCCTMGSAKVSKILLPKSTPKITEIELNNKMPGCCTMLGLTGSASIAPCCPCTRAAKHQSKNLDMLKTRSPLGRNLNKYVHAFV